MVLDNSSDATGDTLNENAPLSDGDSYSASTPSAGPENYRIDTSKLPQPIPIIGRMVGWNEKQLQGLLNHRMLTYVKALNRPATQEEVDALAYWTAKQVSYQSYASPLGIAAGSWRARKTMSTFRFPFWQPNLETFDPLRFPSATFTLLRRGPAMMAWHLLRFALYGGIGMNISDILVATYSTTVAAVGAMQDPRLKAGNEAAVAELKRKRGGLQGPNMPGSQTLPQRIGVRGKAPAVDDASPTGGMFSEDFEALSRETGNGIGSTNDDSRNQSTSKVWPQQQSSAPVPRQQAEPQEHPFDPFGDASPSNEESIRANVPTNQAQRREGSAWERVRRGGTRGSNGGQMKSQEPQKGGWAGLRDQAQSPGADDSAAFSREAESQGLTRDQAQREFDARASRERKDGEYSGSQAQRDFDARVERERRGGDFSSRNGDQKRW